MRNNFRIHPVMVPGEVYELRFVSTGRTGVFRFVKMEKYFAIFTNGSEIVCVLYADVRFARG